MNRNLLTAAVLILFMHAGHATEDRCTPQLEAALMGWEAPAKSHFIAKEKRETFSGGLGLAILFWIAAWLLLRSLSRRSWGVLDRVLPNPMTPEEEAAAREQMRRDDDFFREGDPYILGTAAWSIREEGEQMLRDDDFSLSDDRFFG